MKTLNKIFVRAAFLFTLSITCFNVQAQACKKVNLVSDSLKRNLLRGFAQDCRQNRFFVEDKGIIILESYTNAKSQETWVIYAMIDDRYKDNPPINYDYIENDLILVYKADINGRIIKTSPNDVNTVNQCLENIVANRVYQRPSVKERYVDIKGIDNKTKKVKSTNIILGNYWNSKKIIFNKDKTYKILIGV